jgi:hypothetical protein
MSNEYMAVGIVTCTTRDGKVIESRTIREETKQIALKVRGEVWREMHAAHPDSYIFTNWLSSEDVKGHRERIER